jgi:hypothetical protein
MISNTNDTHGKWVSDGGFIDISHSNELVYTNKAIQNFLFTDSWQFLSANKGMGKTLLMNYKRYVSNKQHPSALTIPSGKPYLDNMTLVDEISRKTQEFITAKESVAIKMWMFSLEVSMISYLSFSIPLSDQEEFSGPLEDFKQYVVGARISVNPTTVFKMLLQRSPSDIVRILKVEDKLENFCKSNVQSEVRIFIDRVDQALKNVLQKTWIVLQGTLLEAAYNLFNGNSHIKIFATIRQEAFANYSSDIKANLRNSTLQLRYEKDELIKIMDKHSQFYEGGKGIDQFLGQTELRRNGLHRDEKTVDFILRHTLHRPRDVVSICSELSFQTNRNDAKSIIQTVALVADDQIIPFIFDESMVFLDSLKKPEERARFMRSLKSNIMTYEEILDLYAEYNGFERSVMGEIGIEDDRYYHPFSELFKVGLLGIITDESTIKFKMPNDYQDFQSLKLPKSKYYFVHPSLSRYIAACGNNNYKVFAFVIVGHDIEWDDKVNNVLVSLQKKLFSLGNEDFCRQVLAYIKGNIDEIERTNAIPYTPELDNLMVGLDEIFSRATDNLTKDAAVEVFSIFDKIKSKKSGESPSRKFRVDGAWEMTESYDYGRTQADFILAHVPDNDEYNIKGKVVISDIMDGGIRFKVEENVIGKVKGSHITLKGVDYKILEGQVAKYSLDKWIGEFRDENTVVGTSLDENLVAGRFTFVKKR